MGVFELKQTSVEEIAHRTTVAASFHNCPHYANLVLSTVPLPHFFYAVIFGNTQDICHFTQK